MKMHILTDDRVKKRGILAEHGMSIFIEYENNNILFDTGQSDVYCHNAALMGIDLSETNCIVLSHGHYDHCGGLIHFPKSNNSPKIYIHENAFANRYASNINIDSYREIGIPWSLNDYEVISKNIVFNHKSLQIAPGITICSEIPSTEAFEEVPKGFYIKDENNMTLDMMRDEQMLIIEHNDGLVVFLGCSHPGIINCLKHALKLFPGKKIDTLVAGMHLENVSPLRLQMTIQHMIDLDIRKVIPLHCTGIYAICEMKRFLGNRCLSLCAGDSLKL